MTAADRPDKASIDQALDRILASPLFARSERLRAFLAYVVTKDMAGQAHQLKGYTIAIDVFRRPEHVNADSDPLVRVHAGKLRKLLAAYYETEGAEALWRIDIPKGSYAPVYRRCPVQGPDLGASGPGPAENPAPGKSPAVIPAVVAQAPAISGKASTPRAKPARRKHWLPAPLASPLALVSLVPRLLFVPLSSMALGVSPQSQTRLAAPVKSVPTALPRVTVRSQGTAHDSARRLADSIRETAGYYPAILLAGRLPAERMPQRRPLDALAFTITTVPAVVVPATRVVLSNDSTGTVLSETLIWDTQVSTDADLLFETLAIASGALAANGEIFRYAQDRDTASPLMRCMLATDIYRREQSREAFVQARTCQEELLVDPSGKSPFLISAGALQRTLTR